MKNTMRPGKTFDLGKSLVQQQQGQVMNGPGGPNIEAALEARPLECGSVLHCIYFIYM